MIPINWKIQSNSVFNINSAQITTKVKQSKLLIFNFLSIGSKKEELTVASLENNTELVIVSKALM